MAWFPFLYYGSAYITEGGILGLESSVFSRGSFGMFLFALVALCFNVILPQVLSWFGITRGSRKKIKRRMPLAILWMIGQLSYSSIMFCALIVKGESRIVLIALAGFNWSLTQWVPFTLINEHLLEDELDAGTVMSLHNVAISLPQILSALLTGCVLWVLRILGATDESRILLSLTAVPSLLAAYQASCIED
jgi:solute carrier family 45 protein 1/2/4